MGNGCSNGGEGRGNSSDGKVGVLEGGAGDWGEMKFGATGFAAPANELHHSGLGDRCEHSGLATEALYLAFPFGPLYVWRRLKHRTRLYEMHSNNKSSDKYKVESWLIALGCPRYTGSVGIDDLGMARLDSERSRSST